MNCPKCNEEEIEPGEYQCGSRQINDEWWESTQCLLNQLADLIEKIKQTQAENDMLRHLLAISKADCIYCGLPKDEMSKCERGFPGCGRADDILLKGMKD